MCFKQEGIMSTFSDWPLKLVDKIIYCGSNISSIESNVIIQIGIKWTVIDKLLIIWKYDFSDEIKQNNITSKQWLFWYYCMDAPLRL